MENTADANKSKAKRHLRVKNDIIIKYYQMRNLMFLSFEEAGILMAKAIIEDDENGLRYQNLDAAEIKNMKEYEARVNQAYADRTRIGSPKYSPVLATAKMNVVGQAANSKRAFNMLKQNLGTDEGHGDTKEIKNDDFILSGDYFQLSHSPNSEKILDKYHITGEELMDAVNKDIQEFKKGWGTHFTTFEELVDTYSDMDCPDTCK